MFIYYNTCTNLLRLQTKVRVFWKQRMEDHQQFENFKGHQAKSDRTRLQLRTYTVVRNEEDWLPDTYHCLHNYTPYPDFTLSEGEAALSLRKQKKRKEQLLAQLRMPPHTL